MFYNFFLLHLNIVTWEGLVRFDYSVWIMEFMLSYANMRGKSAICLSQGSHSQWTSNHTTHTDSRANALRQIYVYYISERNASFYVYLSCIFPNKHELDFVFACEHSFSHLHQNDACPAQLESVGKCERRPLTPVQNYGSDPCVLQSRFC